MKAIAYYRVSTAAQGRSGLGLETQKATVKEFAYNRRLTILSEVVEIESGKRNDRPQLATALDHAKLTGSVLLIAKLDRLSRNAAFLLALRESGVRFLAADIPDANDITIGVLAVIAQAEREAISRRTKDALSAIRMRLKTDGPYRSVRSGRLVKRLGNPNGTKAIIASGVGNAAAVAAVRSAADRRALGLRNLIEHLQKTGLVSATAIAIKLNEQGILTSREGRWHASSVRNVLDRLAALSEDNGTSSRSM